MENAIRDSLMILPVKKNAQLAKQSFQTEAESRFNSGSQPMLLEHKLDFYLTIYCSIYDPVDFLTENYRQSDSNSVKKYKLSREVNREAAPDAKYLFYLIPREFNLSHLKEFLKTDLHRPVTDGFIDSLASLVTTQYTELFQLDRRLFESVRGPDRTRLIQDRIHCLERQKAERIAQMNGKR